MGTTTVSKNKIDEILRDAITSNRTIREILMQLLQISNYRVDSVEYIKLLAVYSDKRFVREIKKLVK